MEQQFDMGDTSKHRNGLYTSQPESELLPFRLIGFGDYICDSQYFTRRKGQGNFLFMLTLSGTGILDYQGEKLELQEGDGVVLDCYPYQYYATMGMEPWHFVWMHFSGTAASAYVQWINGKTVKKLKVDSRWQKNFWNELDLFSQQPGRFTDMTISVWMHQFFNELVQNTKKTSVGVYQETMLEAAAFLREHLNSPIKVKEVAERYGFSVYYFHRIFKESLGHSPYEYLTILRVNRAKQLLAFTQQSLSEIAEEVGYGDVKLFIENFKRHTNQTPARFRREIRKSIEQL